MLRVISMTGNQVTLGDASLSQDASTAPGAVILMAVDQGISLNVTGEIYAITDSGNVVLAVTPLHARGFGN